MYYTYMLRCEDNSIYTGITTEPERRLKEHIRAGKKAAGYTRSHRAVGFIALWQCNDRSMASKLEALIKALPKAAKEELAISGDLGIFRERINTSLCVKIKSEDVTGYNTNCILY